MAPLVPLRFYIIIIIERFTVVRRSEVAALESQFGFPGKKLLFMGGDVGQWNEWNHDTSLDLLPAPVPVSFRLLRWVRDLNTFHLGEASLYEVDFEPSGFEWIDCNDVERSFVTFIRRAKNPADMTLVVLNFTPIPRENYRLGTPLGGYWRECLNSDAPLYGGSGQGNMGGVETVPLPAHSRPYSLSLLLPPLGALFPRHSWNPKS